jgi:chromosome segregation ATPase
MKEIEQPIDHLRAEAWAARMALQDAKETIAKLQGELLEQSQRIETLSRTIVTLQGERDTAAYQLTQLAAVAQVATQQAQAGRGFDLNEPAIERMCWN